MNRAAKGARLEREIATSLSKAGYEVVRGAGSKSYGRIKIDLIAIHPGRKEIFIIQCKNFKSPYASEGANQIGEAWRIFNFNADTKTPMYRMCCKLITNYDKKEILQEMSKER